MYLILIKQMMFITLINGFFKYLCSRVANHVSIKYIPKCLLFPIQIIMLHYIAHNPKKKIVTRL